MAKSLNPVSAPIAAKVLSLSRRHFDRLVKDGTLPRSEQPRLFDLVKIVPAYCRYLRAGAAGTSQMAEARLKLVQSQRRALDQRTRRESGQLIERAEAERVFDAAIVAFTASIDGMPGRLAGHLAAIDQPAKIHEVLADEGRRIRNAAADELGRLAVFEQGQADASATEAHGGPVGDDE